MFDEFDIDGNGTQFAWYHIEKTGLMFEKDWKVAALAHGLSVRRVLLPHVEVHTRFRLLLVVREPRAHTRSLWHQTCAHGGPGNTPLPSCPRFGEWVRRWRDWHGGKGGEVPKGWGGGPIDYQHEALRVALHLNVNTGVGFRNNGVEAHVAGFGFTAGANGLSASVPICTVGLGQR